ncbi:oligopeptide/dipeptide transporter, C-terminal domain protein [Treponema socranskii subsp. socranskii VPI DR56BR1116 = ATCC 35536]|uniref:Oligopeptide/dipeptide transporter, C-terminal domain protein n=4 Tax=Treponema socranskii TaxID=53419 RepID=U1FKC4_TRESO|nr:dipeptide/oligopeptide/nickel ABC transporter permease/ATP-binding protein [Treponema socranskii]ERF59811.1 oligopeptide/dipeptide transporter, C-terminal domain protein [Treponema socranskii subsp. socranskii VPI DR56BR1116 = ATCC 35536]
MKKFINFLKTKRIAFASLIVIVILYAVMLFAEFVAPYPASMSFGRDTFHPANIRITKRGIAAQECRVLDPVSWKYARVKGKYRTVKFFVKGESYKLFGFIPCSRHLFGTIPDEKGERYPVFILGADNLGRDLFSRIVYGSRISLTIGFAASAVSLLLAVLLGGLAGFYGGAADWSLMRLAEFFMLIPSLYLILFLRSLLHTQTDSGTSYALITLILAFVGWPSSARTIRGMVHAIKREDFILNARLEGIPPAVIIFGHIIPQTASLLIVSVALSVPGFIMSETTLSYLGLGISDPAVSWGSLINRNISTLSNLQNYPWLLAPVLLLLTVTLAFNFLGDALRDYFDPYHAVFAGKKFRRKKVQAFGEISRTAPSAFDIGAADDAEARPASCGTQPENDSIASVSAPDVQSAYPAARNFLSVENLSVTFTVFREGKRIDVFAVRGVSFSMQRGEVLGIVGESGSGKSVTVSAIPDLLPQNAFLSGRVYFEGTELSALGEKELRAFRGKKIGMIFQEPALSFDPLQTVGSVFFEALRTIDKSCTKDAAYEKAEALLKEVGLPDPRKRLASYPHQFSGGQLQRIGIALALAQGCELLIADEPTTALDVTIQAQIVSLLMRLQKERGLSVIFISHNIDIVSRIADRIIVMYGGKVMEEGSAESIVRSPRHPYTKALLASSANFGMHYTKERMKSIPGKVCDPSAPERGCPFAPRCAFVRSSCATDGRSCPEMKIDGGAKK